MWESIRIFQQEYGYETVPCLFDETLITFDSMEYPIPVRKDGKCGLVKPDEMASGLCGLFLAGRTDRAGGRPEQYGDMHCCGLPDTDRP